MRWLVRIACVALACSGLSAPASAAPLEKPLIVAQATPAAADRPEDRFNRRFPQKARVGDLIGLPVLDDNDVTLGHVQKVVRTPEGKIRLIVSYSKWFGWFGRPVSVPIEAVVILGRQIDSVDMQPDEYQSAPTWAEGKDQPLGADETIRIALGRR